MRFPYEIIKPYQNHRNPAANLFTLLNPRKEFKNQEMLYKTFMHGRPKYLTNSICYVH